MMNPAVLFVMPLLCVSDATAVCTAATVFYSDAAAVYFTVNATDFLFLLPRLFILFRCNRCLYLMPLTDDAGRQGGRRRGRTGAGFVRPFCGIGIGGGGRRGGGTC